MSKYDPNRICINAITASWNELCIVAHELKVLSEKYEKVANEYIKKGKCPGDLSVRAANCKNIAKELFLAIDRIEKEKEE